MVFNTAAAFLVHHWMMFVLNKAVHQTISNSLVIFISIIVIVIVIVIVIASF